MSLPRHTRAPFDARADLKSRLDRPPSTTLPHLQLSELADVAGVVRLAEVVTSGAAEFQSTGESLDWLGAHVNRQLAAMRRFVEKRLSSPHRGSAAVPARHEVLRRFESSDDPHGVAREVAEAYAHRLLSLVRITRREAGRTRTELRRDLREHGGAAEYFERVDASLRSALVLCVKDADDAVATYFESRLVALFHDALEPFDACAGACETSDAARGKTRLFAVGASNELTCAAMDAVDACRQSEASEQAETAVAREHDESGEHDELRAERGAQRAALRDIQSDVPADVCSFSDPLWKVRDSINHGALRAAFAQVDALCRVAMAEEEALIIALVDAATSRDSGAHDQVLNAQAHEHQADETQENETQESNV